MTELVVVGNVYSEPNVAVVFNGSVTPIAAAEFAVPAANEIFIDASDHFAYRVVFALTVYGVETALPVGVVDQPAKT